MMSVLEQSAPQQLIDWIGQAEHLTLSGAMVIAIAVLWKSLQAKDGLLMQSIRTMTEALAETATSNRELRKIIEDSVNAKRQLAESIDMLRKDLNHNFSK